MTKHLQTFKIGTLVPDKVREFLSNYMVSLEIRYTLDNTPFDETINQTTTILSRHKSGNILTSTINISTDWWIFQWFNGKDRGRSTGKRGIEGYGGQWGRDRA